MTPEIDLTRDVCERRLADALLEITRNPDHWDQGVWALLTDIRESEVRAALDRHEWPCGTAACLAGTVVIQAGFINTATIYEHPFMIIDEAGTQLLTDHPWYQRNWNEPTIDFGGLAALLTGLNIDQSSRIFNSDNGLAELWALAAVFTLRRVLLPDELVETVSRIDAQRVARRVSFSG